MASGRRNVDDESGRARDDALVAQQRSRRLVGLRIREAAMVNVQLVAAPDPYGEQVARRTDSRGTRAR
ncbi:MAG TPA: hypothetical protein VF752_08665 [Thermoleophilaceae bacterium]